MIEECVQELPEEDIQDISSLLRGDGEERDEEGQEETSNEFLRRTHSLKKGELNEIEALPARRSESSFIIRAHE